MPSASSLTTFAPLASFTPKIGERRLVSRDSLDRLIALDVPLLEVQNVDWSMVQRTIFFAYQQFQYVYPSIVRDLAQRLIVQPKKHYAGQRLLDFKLAVEPIALQTTWSTDQFDNQIIELEVARINHWTTFEVMFTVEHTKAELPLVSKVEAAMYIAATPLTIVNARMLEVVQKLQRQATSALDLAQRISAWVSETMQYKNGTTTIQTSAIQALEIGSGLCQDYAHIMLALARAAGLPARYVSGHMLGEGGSHAWVEVLLELATGQFAAIGFDPTNARQPNLGYTVVAIGRDYNDVPPTAGSFTGDAAGELVYEKVAGLLELHC